MRVRNVMKIPGLAALIGLLGSACLSPAPIGSLSQASTTGANDDGTRLAASIDSASIACDDNGLANVTLSGSLSTTGSVDSADITVSVDGGDAVAAGVVEPVDFVHDGRDKAANWTVDLSLPDGTHQVTVCFTQSGAQGRLPKQVCATATVVVDCQEGAVCGRNLFTFFGNLVHNPVLCNGNGPGNIPIHLRATALNGIYIHISGPNGFSLVDQMHHAGDSCIYQYNWVVRDGNGGAGSYVFTATDGLNGDVLASTTQDLVCN